MTDVSGPTRTAFFANYGVIKPAGAYAAIEFGATRSNKGA